MKMQIGETLTLTDKQRRPLGLIVVEEQDGDLLCGHFEPNENYSRVESLFREFEKAANDQSLGKVDELDRAIDSLDLHITTTDQAESAPVNDVQIWSDSGISWRLRTSASLPPNGRANGQQQRRGV